MILWSMILYTVLYIILIMYNVRIDVHAYKSKRGIGLNGGEAVEGGGGKKRWNKID